MSDFENHNFDHDRDKSRHKDKRRKIIDYRLACFISIAINLLLVFWLFAMYSIPLSERVSSLYSQNQQTWTEIQKIKELLK